MLAGGGFLRASPAIFPPTHVLLVALAGAVLGDQTGYLIGRFGGAAMTSRLESEPHRALVFAKGTAHCPIGGAALACFFQYLAVQPAWALRPISWRAPRAWPGPPPPRFTLWDTAGEAIWVSVYVGLGYAFSSRITQLADLLGNSIAFLTAGLVTILLGVLLFRLARRGPKQ